LDTEERSRQRKGLATSQGPLVIGDPGPFVNREIFSLRLSGRIQRSGGTRALASSARLNRTGDYLLVNFQVALDVDPLAFFATTFQ
jgi:hypothetical protein